MEASKAFGWSLWALVSLALAVWIPWAGAEPASRAAAAGPPPRHAQQAEEVGSDTCLICHDTYTSVQRTPHAESECEACHGPGGQHVESGGEQGELLSFAYRDPGWGVDRCQSCHRQDPHLSSFAQSSHGRNLLACVDCHQMHPQRQARSGLLVSGQTELCAACHRASTAQFNKPYGHPVLEGAMDCGDCHSPHSEDLRAHRRLAEGTEAGCVSCHSDKRGPFVFEHAPGKVGGCVSCHQPHGSVNPKMLNRSLVHQLCLECHSMTRGAAGGSPFANHNIRLPRWRNCTTCHREIHGSNASPAFLR